MESRTPVRNKLIPVAAIALLFLAGVILTPTGSGVAGSLPNGTPISVTIDSPATGTIFPVPLGDTADVALTGSASVGEGEPDATLVYVIDVSDSTWIGAGGDCGGDQNSDGDMDRILDCEVAAILDLNSAAIAKGSVDEVGVAVFGTNGAPADMSAAAGEQLISAPDSAEFETVVRSVHYGINNSHASGIDLFTHKTVGAVTNFAAGMAAAHDVVQASSNSVNIVVFLSDGESNWGGPEFPGALNDLVSAGAVVMSFAVGSASSCTGGSDGTLNEMATATGGTCTQVADPSALPDLIPDLVQTSLDSLSLTVDLGIATALDAADLTEALPLPGADSLLYTTTAEDLGPGFHTLCVSATGTDAGGSGTVADCIRIQVVNVVPLDIHPTSCPNPVNTRGKGVLPVAIPGDATLDVHEIVPETVRLEGVAATKWAYEDVTTPFGGDLRTSDSCSTDGADGWTDLTLKFRNQDIVAALGPVSDGEVRVLTLTGELEDGTTFVASDIVVIHA